jgi:hypothetical protein
LHKDGRFPEKRFQNAELKKWFKDKDIASTTLGFYETSSMRYDLRQRPENWVLRAKGFQETHSSM